MPSQLCNKLNNRRKLLERLIIVSALLALISGCANNLIVTGDFPKPLIAAIPLVAKVQYTSEFESYVYVDDSNKRALKSVDLGGAQVALFDQVFGTLLTLKKTEESDVDLTITPENLDFQYSVPSQTKLNIYEVWLKYRLKIVDATGEELADWVIKGYGKTPTATFKSSVKAFDLAANIALRDIGTQLAIGFTKQSSIEQLLIDRDKKMVSVEEEIQ